MAPIISIVGKSGSGKTTLIEKVIAELTRRGYSVGVLKHDAHGFEIDHECKDSLRHKQAGASTVALSSPDKFAVIKDVVKEWPPERLIASYFPDVDVVVIEGFKKSPFRKIEVVRKGNSSRPVCGKDKLLIAFASDFRVSRRLPVFNINDFKGIADLIEKDFAEYYENSAKQATGEAKKVLEMLGKWERGHEVLFKNLHDKAYEVYNQMPWGG